VNVLFLTHAFPRTADDAAGSFILRLAVALRSAGVTATVVAPHAHGLRERETLRDVDVRRFRYAPERYESLAYAGTMAEQVAASWSARLALAGLVASSVVAAARVAKETRPSVLHAHWWFPSGLAATAVSLLRGLPMVTTLHGSDVRLARRTIGAGSLYARVASRSRATTAVSSWLSRNAAALAPRSPAPRVEPMPVDTELFSPAGSRSPNRLLFVGRLSAQKGVDRLLQALALLPPDISLDVVGDGAELDALRRVAGSLGVASRVRWHGAQPQSTLVSLYQSATAVVIPSIDEGLGLVAVEAQLCEAPVVAFDSGGIPDVVTDGVTGILARPATAEAMAAALRELLARPDRGAALGQAGRTRALARFSPYAVAQRYAALYREAIDRVGDRAS
jgi:glycosyltransferase involved in cell wall biosynthesis